MASDTPSVENGLNLIQVVTVCQTGFFRIDRHFVDEGFPVGGAVANDEKQYDQGGCSRENEQKGQPCRDRQFLFHGEPINGAVSIGCLFVRLGDALVGFLKRGVCDLRPAVFAAHCMFVNQFSFFFTNSFAKVGRCRMGCQVREHTDELTGTADHLIRDQWIDELNATCLCKNHHSFFKVALFWSLLYSAGRKVLAGLSDPLDRWPEPKWIMVMVVTIMLVAVVITHIAVDSVGAVFPIGTTAVLLSAFCR